MLGSATGWLQTSAAEPDSACAYLTGLAEAKPEGPRFFASYPTVESGPLHAAAFTYDNAVATIALVACGRRDLAQRIGDALLAALDGDRFWHDGRLRNAYAAGPVGAGVVKLSGWWDATQNRWLEDRYQVGSDSGNMAWAMLALLALDRAETDATDRQGASRIGAWVAARRDFRGSGGFTGGTFGHEPAPVEIAWKSTEHNTDVAAAFQELADATGDPLWRSRATAAAGFVQAMWDAACSCFSAGTTDDGVTRNATLALDAQIWPLLALPELAAAHADAFDTAAQRMRHGGGFAYGPAGEGIWTEGTAQAALLARLLHRPAQAAALEAEVAAERAPAGGYYATSAATLPTGFDDPTDPTQPRLYYHLPHLAAAAWAALAERHFNPFTARPID